MELNGIKQTNYNISDIAGHEKQLGFLNGLFFHGRMPSGLLFYGQKNIGKRLAATAFAASVLCREYALYAGKTGAEAQPLPAPSSVSSDGGIRLSFCGKCPSCAGVLTGTSQNLMLVEPSGNSIKVENIHAAGSFLGLAPAFGGHRFVIIDGAEAMNAASSNALLKMLEEPAEKTVFILIVSNAGMLLPTVISRCLLLGFGPVPDRVLSDVFRAKFPALEEGELKLYLKLAGGSYSGFYGLMEGKYLEKRNFLINEVFNKLFKGLDGEHAYDNPYDMSDNFNAGSDREPKKGKNEKGAKDAAEDKSAIFETILIILRDIYIYRMTKNEKLLYNEDMAEEIKRFAVNSDIGPKSLAQMIETTVSHMEKISGYNLNKAITSDSYFSDLLFLARNNS